jgi:dihydroorotate dehydrogenase
LNGRAGDDAMPVAADAYWKPARALLFRLEGERAHDLALRGLGLLHRMHLQRLLAAPVPPLPTRVFGLDFPNPVGLAAGLDKNAEHVDALAALGFGFIEVGTVTPRAQPGNPRPRLFRLPAHGALINRMGFNNLGLDALLRNLERMRWRGVLGVNIGRNRDTPNERAVADYLLGLERIYARAGYVTINISSPNTQGLRDLQARAALHELIGTLREAQERLAARHGARKPMLLKIAPDLDAAAMDAIANVLAATGIDGLICTNTTLMRVGVDGATHGAETGGLSGTPLRAASTAVVRGMRMRLPDVPIVGVGGIDNGEAAAEKVAAGASLVQLYTGLIYRGPALVRECVKALRAQRETGHAVGTP